MPEDRASKATRSQVSWRLNLLGTAHLLCGAQTLNALERRTAALLAYLAFEGPVSRSKIAGLLWPDSTEDTARANLRQRLKRLREALGTDLILATDQSLRLRPDVDVDAVSLESLAFTGEFDALLRLSGEALGGHDYDDLPDLEVWVLALRERLVLARRVALTELTAQAEQQGAISVALEYAQRLLETDPVSEDAHRRVMRFCYLLGDRTAALRAYQQCVDQLQRELGVEPLPATLELAALIARGSALPDQPAPLPSALPLAIQRPPLLAGREHEWALLEAAWQARKAIFIAGPPGVGKTRLMLDFALSKGGVALLEGRAGDAGVPYATHARSFQRLLSQHPDLALAPWMRRELARLDPTLEQDVAPAPLEGDAQKLRFYEAVAQTVLLVSERGVDTIVLDDLQFMDAASFELGQFLVPKSLSEAGRWPRSVSAFRSGELSAPAQAQLEQLLESGAAALIELGPLGAMDVKSLLASITQIKGLERLAAPLTRYTGGNPLFVIETIKHLFETDQLQGEFPLRLPPPGQVAALIQRRLERLSPAALRVAQVAAIAGTDFHLELGARVLGTDALHLIPAITELEGAQVMRDEGFAHDLILEATLIGLPNTVRLLLHSRVAAQLEAQQLEVQQLEIRSPNRASTAPARIAYHWLEAGQHDQAIPHLIAAANASAAAYRFEEAIGFNLRAADLLNESAQLDAAFERVAAAQSWAQTLGSSALTEAVLERLERTAVTPAQRSYAQLGRAQRLFDMGEMIAAEHYTREARDRVRDGDDLLLRGELSALLGAILWAQGRFLDCAALFEEAAELSEKRGDIANVTINLTNLAALEATLLHHRKAIATFERALKTLEVKDDLVVRTGLLTNLATTQMQMGQGSVALATLLRSKTLLDDLPDVLERRLTCFYQLATCELQLGAYTDAIRHIERVLELAPATEAHVRPSAQRNSALIALICGRDTEAETWLERAMSTSTARPDTKVSMLIVRGLIAERRGLKPLEAFDAAEHLGIKHPLVPIALQLWRCITVPPIEALKLAHDALERTRSLELFGAQIMAHTRLAQAFLSFEQSSQALEQTERAMQLLSEYDALPLGFQHAEVWLTHARALDISAHPALRAHLERSMEALIETADRRVPPEYRESFLTRNPINAAIVEAARATRLI